LIIEIAPPTLRQDGIRVALQRLLDTLADPEVGTDLDVSDEVALSDDEAALVFRVAQEALRNVATHAHARRVSVILSVIQGATTLTVADDGRGFSRTDVEDRQREGHVGTRGIEEIAAEAGARLTIRSESGHGTKLSLALPRRSRPT
jgi:two-component system, NarL family, sensor kinase